MMFIFIWKIDFNMPVDKFRNIIFEIQVPTNLRDRLDRSVQFWDKFNVSDETLKIMLGCYEIDRIDNPC